MKSENKPTPHYFTLIELLVVVTIIAILVSLLMPAMRKVMFTAKTTACTKTLQNIASSSLLYAEDYNDIYPNDSLLRNSAQLWSNGGSHTNTEALLAPYIDDGKESVTCPAQRRDLTYQKNWGQASHATNPHLTYAFDSLPLYQLYFSSTGGGAFGPALGPYTKALCVETDIRSECMGYHRSRWNEKSLPANMRDIYMIRVGDNFKVMDYGFNYDDGNKTLKGHKSKIIASDYTQMKTGFGHQYIQSNHIWGPKEYDNWSWDRGRAERWEDPRYRMQLPTTITEKDEGGEVYSNFAFDDGSVKTYNNIFWEHWRDQMTWTLKNEGQFLPNDSATD